MRPPTCSVVVPVLDDAEELSGLLSALAVQTEPPLEVIVVDNGSMDDSAARATQAGCTVLHQGIRGIAAAASLGYDAARGDLILRCDADSRPAPDWVAAHRRVHRTARPQTVAVTGPATVLLPRLSIRAPRAARALGTVLGWSYVGAYLLCSASALGHAPLFGTTMSMQRSWWQRVRTGVDIRADVHDDMHLSFLVAPDEHVAVSAAVSVGMSARALAPSSLRWRRALTTLRLAWHAQPPWERWERRLRARLTQSQVSG